MDSIDETLPPVLAPTLRIINSLLTEGLIESYAIGGSVAIVFYSEPFDASGMDVFCYLAQSTLIFHLGQIWKYLENLGCRSDKEWMIIEGVPVQFLPPAGPLEEEAMKAATSLEVEGVATRVFQLEYAMTIKIQTGRAKDWNQIEIALNSADPDITVLESILQKFGLFDKWRNYLDRRI